MASDDRLQLYVTKRGTLVLRRPPRGEPTPAQQTIRDEFTRAARSARGKKMEEALPPAASSVRVALTGARVARKTNEPGWKRVLRLWLVNRGYTEEDAGALVAALPD